MRIRMLIYLGGIGMKNYFSKSEIALWSASVLLIITSFFCL